MGISNTWSSKVVPRRLIPPGLVLVFLLTFSSCTCIYFNTFHNVRKNFNGAENSRKTAGRDKAIGGEVKQYTDAITKASRVLERHPNSSWVDDALYTIGASYYYIGEFAQASRKFKELMATHPESPFIRQSRILLAKAKLMEKEEAEAVVIFEQIFEEESDRKLKAEAARSLGQYYFDGKEYDKANQYFGSLIDSLGDDIDRLRALMYEADGYFNRFMFAPALDTYERSLKYAPDSLQFYHINFRMAESEFLLSRIGSGLDRLSALAANQLYYDSLATIRLKMAEGYVWDGDLESAIATYEKVAAENPKKIPAAIAYYQLGLIYQYDYDNLERALHFYKKAREESRNSPINEDVMRRVTKLSLLEQYTKKGDKPATSDTTEQGQLAAIESLAENQFLLGELFYFDLEKPDSAAQAYRTVLGKYPQSPVAPRALISLAYISREDFADTVAADTLLRRVLRDYPHCDEVERVIHALGLAGTAADTGYAAARYHRGENHLEQFMALDSSQYFLRLKADSGRSAVTARRGEEYADRLGLIDSARTEFQYVADSFPKSAYNEKSRYTLLYLYDRYLTPGDSTLMDQYANYVDSFPNTEFAKQIEKDYNIRPKAGIRQASTPAQDQQQSDSTEETLSTADSTLLARQGYDSTVIRSQAISRFITNDEGDTLLPAQNAYLREDVAFDYPLEALAYNIETTFWFHIRINFSGDVVDAIMKTPASPSKELNQRIMETVKNTKFDPSRIPPELYDSWFYYTKEVRIPEQYRRR